MLRQLASPLRSLFNNLFKVGKIPKAGNIAAYLFIIYTAQSYSALYERCQN